MATNSLDTNLIVHYILGDIPKQRQAVIKLLNTPNTIHQIADLALTEAVFVFESQYQKPRQEIYDHLTSFLNVYSNVLDYNQQIFAEAFPLYLAHPKLSFNDCYLSAHAEVHHAEPLFTFDRKLALQAENAKLLR